MTYDSLTKLGLCVVYRLGKADSCAVYIITPYNIRTTDWLIRYTLTRAHLVSDQPCAGFSVYLDKLYLDIPVFR